MERPGGISLNIPDVYLWWQGYGGLKIRQLTRKAATLKKVGPHPHAIVIHLGGNDIGEITAGTLCLMAVERIKALQRMFPTTRLIFSQVLPRLRWRHSSNAKAMNKCRRNLNRVCSKAVIEQKGGYIKHPDIVGSATELFRSEDGVHLSSLGNAIFLNSLQGGIQHILNGGTVFPPSF